MHDPCSLERCLCHTSQQPVTDAIYERPDVKARQRGLPERKPKPQRERRWLGFPIHHQIPEKLQKAVGFKTEKRKPRPRRKAA